jgi:hypothetical protein
MWLKYRVPANKHKALSSNPSTAMKKKDRKKKETEKLGLELLLK